MLGQQASHRFDHSPGRVTRVAGQPFRPRDLGRPTFVPRPSSRAILYRRRSHPLPPATIGRSGGCAPGGPTHSSIATFAHDPARIHSVRHIELNPFPFQQVHRNAMLQSLAGLLDPRKVDTKVFVFSRIERASTCDSSDIANRRVAESRRYDTVSLCN